MIGTLAVAGIGASSVSGAGADIIDYLPWPAQVSGGEVSLPDREASRTTVDGWVLHAGKSNEVINLAPALDGGMSTGEFFGSMDARVWIDGAGAPELTGAMFETGYQIGCGVDISSGVDATVGFTQGIAPHADAGITGGPSVNIPLGVINGMAVGADATATVQVGVDGKTEADQSFTTHLAPGTVTDVPLVSMPVDAGYKRAAAGVTGAHFQINGCLGPVSVRSYVTVSSVSPTSVDAVSVYGDPRRVR
ncbi:MspA family porin [Corynebacterium terpenotabidum]|uniref:MspA protein n=1 Tax=Corynebacterium terpenotabidum Y-11 TaxID=1200352 RepID=S4X9P7_9CORY|nr:MspA family porin [Corynebacterium terpenotabidum]AGP29837.1 hypothetical protein A606_00910 [Corynebacterium terpenotabidum Y-11]